MRESIGVRMPNWIGDVVMATPFLRGLRTHYPDSQIVLYLRPHLIPILEGCSWFDRQIPLRDRGKAFFSSLRQIRREGHTCWFSLPRSLRAAAQAVASKAPVRVGYSLGLGRFAYTHRAHILPHEWEGRLHPVPTDVLYLRLLEAVGHPYWNRRLELPLTDQARQYAKAFFAHHRLDPAQPIVALNPGAAFGSAKLWPPEYFASLADELIRRYQVQILLLCGPGEEEIVRKIRQTMALPCATTEENIIPLNRLGAVLARTKLLISTDSGPRHFATAFSVPTIVLCGPIHPGYTELDAPELVLLYDLHTPCRPCHRRRCPLPHHPCMRSLTPELVLEKVRELRQKGVLQF